MKIKFITIIFFLFSFNSFADDFKISFEWGDIPKCTTGNPGIVSNPIFQLSNVPENTKWIHFKLVDRMSTFNHGGGGVEFTGQSEIKPGVFMYKSPCPPSGSHIYVWTASAKSNKSSWGSIEQAKASKSYPY
jgi:hypothetical protein